jgi:hypothetical protein
MIVKYTLGLLQAGRFSIETTAPRVPVQGDFLQPFSGASGERIVSVTLPLTGEKPVICVVSAVDIKDTAFRGQYESNLVKAGWRKWR